jgi:indole-3-glycerol phosphate synthase
MSTVLDKIVTSKRLEIAAAKAALPESALRRRLVDAPPVRDFAGALSDTGGIKLIAEVKKASPSAGVLRADFDPAAIAAAYEAHGTSAISVLTDAPFFQGSLDNLGAVRRTVSLPVLRKDFILDSYQIIEARVHGADAVLLIAEILPGNQLAERLSEIHDLGMEALVELYDAENLPRVIDSGARVIGINNRNLHTFVTDLAHTINLAGRVPPDRVLVSESGIRSRADVLRLQAAGARAILVGETLMRSPDIGQKVDELLERTGDR